MLLSFGQCLKKGLQLNIALDHFWEVLDPPEVYMQCFEVLDQLIKLRNHPLDRQTRPSALAASHDPSQTRDRRRRPFEILRLLVALRSQQVIWLTRCRFRTPISFRHILRLGARRDLTIFLENRLTRLFLPTSSGSPTSNRCL